MRNRHVVCLIVFALLACTGTCAARAEEKLPEGKDLTALLEKMQIHRRENALRSQQYTNEEISHNVNFDKKGKTTTDTTQKFDNLFVEGLPYRRLIEKNNKPLSGKDAAKEEKRYQKAVAQRKDMGEGAKRNFFQKNFSAETPDNYLTTLFENLAVRMETVDGRETLVVESTPRADAHPTDKGGKQAIEWKQTIWLDRQDLLPVKIWTKKLVDGDHLLAGTTNTILYERHVETSAKGNPHTVWLLSSSRSEFRLKLMMLTFRGVTEQRWSNYKKFQVDVRLLDDAEELDDATSGN